MFVQYMFIVSIDFDHSLPVEIVMLPQLGSIYSPIDQRNQEDFSSSSSKLYIKHTVL
jgi:hypothetical protein